MDRVCKSQLVSEKKKRFYTQNKNISSKLTLDNKHDRKLYQKVNSHKTLCKEVFNHCNHSCPQKL